MRVAVSKGSVVFVLLAILGCCKVVLPSVQSCRNEGLPMAQGVLFPPLNVAAKSAVHQSHVDAGTACFGFRVSRTRRQSRSFIGRHGLGVVLITLAGEPSHLGSDFSIADLQDAGGILVLEREARACRPMPDC